MLNFTSLLIIGVVAVAVPLLLGLFPVVKVPAVVLEIIGGVLVGPTVLGWVHLDAPVRVVSDLGLGFLLFMAGFEIDLRRLSGSRWCWRPGRSRSRWGWPCWSDTGS